MEAHRMNTFGKTLLSRKRCKGGKMYKKERQNYKASSENLVILEEPTESSRLSAYACTVD
jgi:hypothetical protein